MTTADQPSQPATPGSATSSAAPTEDALEAVQRHLLHEEQQLLGQTISVTDEQWREPSLLAGWSRGHVATHIARQADGMRRLTEGVLAGVPGTMYDSREARAEAIEHGSGRTGLEIQTDLDTSAGALRSSLAEVAAADLWDSPVHASDDTEFPARLLPLGRLTEVALHHIDLDLGTTADDLDPDLATWLLEWITFRLGPRVEHPFRISLATPDGAPSMINLGDVGENDPVISGTPQTLVGWLSGRAVRNPLDGADLITPPAL
ncbi:maleylpyruvate isomerase family mycothiol-dependent enzyme [Propionibacteriaceae bacterium Y1700]|uniref:maleylpyruvate isomerase family mycothiol-dependent enzyme n=1 Tax=Microlunatus sp. Y1700 TaxID=3418487 RepID=UPI003DA70C83